MAKKQKPQRKRHPVDHEYLFGVNPITEAIKAGRRKFFKITVKDGASGKPVRTLIDFAKQKKIMVETSSIDNVAKLANADGHQGIVASVSPPVYSRFENLVTSALEKPNPQVIALLDGIMDPRNLGAIIRSAEAFKLFGLVFPLARAASYTPVAVKASAGAGEHMRLCRVTNMAEAARELVDNGFDVIALEGSAKQPLEISGKTPTALVLGGEGTGVRPLVIKRCSRSAKIAIPGKVGSLNVAQAAAIAFYVATVNKK